MVLHSGAQLRGEKLTTVGDFTVEAGQRVPFALTHGPSHLADPLAPDAEAALDEIEAGMDVVVRRVASTRANGASR